MVWLAGQSAVIVTMPIGLQLSSNDHAGKFHRKLTSLRLPSIAVKLVLANGLRRTSWVETMHLFSDAYIDIYSSPLGWANTAQAQVQFVRAQDILTGRTDALFDVLDMRCHRS